MSPIVSVVITTKNEEKNIENCLRSIRLQTYLKDKIEIVVVDNNSSDTTKQIAKRFTKKVYNQGLERSAQRNLGAKVSAGKYYLYLDADMMLHEGVLRESIDLMEKNPSIVALYIPEIVMGNTFFAKVRRHERSFYNATVIDCVRFIRKDIVQAIGGFAEDLAGPEDWDFDKKIRAKGKVALISSPVYHNETNVTLRSYLRKKSYYSKSFNRYIQKWGADDPDIKKQFGIWYRYVIVFVEGGKWVKLITHPILTTGMLFLRLLVGIRYLQIKNKF